MNQMLIHTCFQCTLGNIAYSDFKWRQLNIEPHWPLGEIEPQTIAQGGNLKPRQHQLDKLATGHQGNVSPGDKVSSIELLNRGGTAK